VLVTLNEQVKVLEAQVREHFGQHPDAEIYLSQPGIGPVLGDRVLAEFGDDRRRYADGKARRNYAATSPVTRASGKKKVVAARFVHHDRLVDALHAQAQSALNASPGAHAFYDQQRAKGHEHNDALRRLANRLVGILHGCLKTGTLRRSHCLGPPGKNPAITRRSLTPKPQGCLCRVPGAGAATAMPRERHGDATRTPRITPKLIAAAPNSTAILEHAAARAAIDPTGRRKRERPLARRHRRIPTRSKRRFSETIATNNK
jgi:hypothetical protein